VFTQICCSRRILAAFVISLLTIAVFEQSPNAATALPGGWTPADIGAPALHGSAQGKTCTTATGCPLISINGAGLGLTGKSDQLTFVYQRLTGDGAVTMRLLSLAGASTSEAGLMLRETLTASSREASIMIGASTLTFRSRVSTGATTGSLTGPRAAWLRLERAGQTITGSISADGTRWTVVASQKITLPASIYIGVAVTSRSASAVTSALVSSMSLDSEATSLPSGWSSSDVGTAKAPGTASYSSGSFLASSAGAGFASTSDAFRFVYSRTKGDAKLSARVVVSEGKAGHQAGIVLRSGLEAGATEVALVADNTGVILARRVGSGLSAAKTKVASTVAPVFLQLDQRGAIITASYSTDGSTWKSAGGAAVTFGAEVYAGLAVAAGTGGGTGGAAFDRLSLVSVAANEPPVVSLTSPRTAAVITEGESLAMAATASDSDDELARVEFAVNGVKVGSDTAAPYAASWTAGKAGVYSVVATAFDSDGATAESLPALVTVLPKLGSGGGSTGPDEDPDSDPEDEPGDSDEPPPPPPPSIGRWTLFFDASPDHATLNKYVLDIYSKVTYLKVATRDLGKPAHAADGTVRVDVDGLIAALPGGLFDVVVRAVASGGEASSYAFTLNK
jgi:regulation of enolase protein 1 (concanavalin A-like superfamily)